jgi:hypothetical protein
MVREATHRRAEPSAERSGLGDEVTSSAANNKIRHTKGVIPFRRAVTHTPRNRHANCVWGFCRRHGATTGRTDEGSRQ